MTVGARSYYSTGVAFAGVGLAGDALEQIGGGSLRLFQIGGFSPPTNSEYFVQLFDLAAPPNPGDSPFQEFDVAPGSSFSWDPSLDGLLITLGLYYGISTTPGIYTAPTGATLSLFAQYVDQI